MSLTNLDRRSITLLSRDRLVRTANQMTVSQ